MVSYREVTGFPVYRVGDDGSVWSKWERRGRGSFVLGKWKKLSPCKTKSGHLSVSLCNFSLRKRKYVHRLVLEAFIGPCPFRFVGCHNDGKPENNNLENLRWDSRKGNLQDMVIHGTNTFGERNKHAKLTDKKVNSIRSEYRENSKVTQSELAKTYGVSRETIGNIINERSWTHI